MRQGSFWLRNVWEVFPELSCVLVAKMGKGICEEGGVNKRSVCEVPKG
jgi:hypothetical protein